jgi:hypothetical protein
MCRQNYWCWRNIGGGKILASTKYGCRQNPGLEKILASTKSWRRQIDGADAEESLYCLPRKSPQLLTSPRPSWRSPTSPWWCCSLFMQSSSVALPPATLLLWADSLLRLWVSGQEVQRGDGPLHPHPISAARDLNGRSLGQPLILGLWVYELILDSDGDHFLFSPLFDRTPVSRYIDCWSLAKNQGILGGRRHFVGAKICGVFSTAGWYNKPVQYGRESAHKRKAAGGNATLTTACKESNNHQGDVGDLQLGLGEVSSCGLCRAKQ